MIYIINNVIYIILYSNAIYIYIYYYNYKSEKYKE